MEIYREPGKIKSQNMIEMKYYKGGLKLRDPQKSYWGSIMNMIENADKIDCLSYS